MTIVVRLFLTKKGTILWYTYKGDIMNFLKKNCKYIIAALLFLLFIIILINIDSKEIAKFDTYIYNLIPKNATLTKIMKCITFLGETVTIISLCVIFTLIFIFKDKKISLSIPINLIGMTIIVQALKRIVQRTRPIGINLITETGFSFPSGHTASSLALYGYLIYLINKKGSNKTFKIFITIFLTVIILGVGISRIYLGVHYASDVLAGLSLSLSYLIIFTSIKPINRDI